MDKLNRISFFLLAHFAGRFLFPCLGFVFNTEAKEIFHKVHKERSEMPGLVDRDLPIFLDFQDCLDFPDFKLTTRQPAFVSGSCCQPKTALSLAAFSERLFSRLSEIQSLIVFEMPRSGFARGWGEISGLTRGGASRFTTFIFRFVIGMKGPSCQMKARPLPRLLLLVVDQPARTIAECHVDLLRVKNGSHFAMSEHAVHHRLAAFVFS